MQHRTWGIAATPLWFGLLACSPFPPAETRGAHGALDGHDPFCTIYPQDGYAAVDLDGFRLVVTLPPYPDRWGRGQASLTEVDDALCEYGAGGSAARVQYGQPIEDPTCDGCSSRYRALFVEGLDFPGSDRACAVGFSCDTSVCRATAPASADRYYVWCDSPEDFAL
ncbi:MAG: hypothetical protein H6709_18060 [Kofleriaceae bacterium]|nr:hypothetical protein [Myxococcales bacterium]MCB9559730.1 hypothetical protein [Kofleriaceae bacterium]MCB9573990.1 hypothetical protein [Kofleriaceae bacterium]